MPVSRSDCPPPGRAEQITTRIAYLVLGVGVSSWAALVPYAKARLGLDEAVLGMLLLCVGVGSLLSMPFTGLISGRFGCRKVILVSGFIFLAMLPLLASVESIWLMALCLFLFGASIGMMDVSLTIQAVFVEQAAGRAMMSGFHCLYSVGGICGAGGMALLLGFLAPHLAMFVICLFMIALLAAFGRHFLPYGSEGETPLFVVPRGIVLLIGVLCFIMYLSEGTILDWGALFMTAERGTEASRAGLAFACFSVAMTIGRLVPATALCRRSAMPAFSCTEACAPPPGSGWWSPGRGHGLRSPGLRWSVSAFRTSCPCFSRLRPARSSCP